MLTAKQRTMVAFALGLVLAATIAAASGPVQRFAKMIGYPGAKEVLVVAEGEFEPRSVGSYSVRIYSGLNPKYPLDDYIAGVVRPRNGIIEAVRFHDFDGDGRAEIVVVIGSAGTGGYRSADVLGFKERSLALLGSVNGLAKDADPIGALKDRIGKGREEPR